MLWLFSKRAKKHNARVWHDHSPGAIAERLQAGPAKVYLKDSIYGAIDGAVTTFAVVSGVAGAGLSSGVIIILGLANLLADGFSMGASNFLGTRAENQRRERARADEYAEIDSHPEGEREEIRQIFAAKGFSGDNLEQVVSVITEDRERWVETMLQEEHGLSLQVVHPLWAGAVTFLAFMLAGILPLATFLLNWGIPDLIAQPFLWSSIITGLAFFLIGICKAQYVEQTWYWSGLETFLVGGLAAFMAYGVGILLKGII
ncbi:VIT1/CCC1 transporter family protein [Maricurvus nonylphenolicus]|uniref:VIT1/CCC1 transporter family protein n=1 Tax=Maricurvus nonylphenolicus TaxID=1008307 RepID=UPI0036F288F4